MKNFEFETNSVNLRDPDIDLDMQSTSMLDKPENKKITFFDKLEDFADDHPMTVYGILAVLSLTVYTVVEIFKFKSKNK